MWKTFKLEILISLVCFVLIATVIFSAAYERNTKVYENCIKTDLVVIGNKGRKTSVYDCGTKL